MTDNSEKQRYETDHIDYDSSKLMCDTCNQKFHDFSRKAEFKGEEGNLQEGYACLAIGLPASPLENQEQLEEIAKKLCPHAGRITDFYRIEGEIADPRIRCDRHSKPE